MESWFLKSGDVETGPYSVEELQFLMTRKQLQSSDLLRQGKSGDWSRVEHVQQFKRPVRGSSKALDQSGAYSTARSKPDEQLPVLPTAPEQILTPPPIARGNDQQPTVIAGGVLVALLLGLLVYLLQTVLAVPNETGGGGGTGQGITGLGDSGPDGSGSSGSSLAPTDLPDLSASGGGGTDGSSSSGSSLAPADLPDLSVSGGGGTTNLESKSNPTEQSPSRTSVSAPAINPPSPPTSSQSRFVVDDLRELNSRLDRESAKTGDVQVSLMWSKRNDVDLHVVTPSGELINFAHRQSECRGSLDVDMNADRFSDKPVENIFWPTGQAPHGTYKVYVHLYAVQGGPVPTPFQVYVKKGGQPAEPFRGKIQTGSPLLVTEFTY